MTDARNWGTHQTSFLEIGGSTIIPVGDRINTHVSAAAETFEIFRQGKYLVFEGEVGSHRMRIGTLDRRAVTISAANDTLTFGSAHPYETGDGPLRIDATVRGNLSSLVAPLINFQRNSGAPNDFIFKGGSGFLTSWVQDGFQVGDSITISRTVSNNGTQTIAAISTQANANDTLEFGPGDPIVAEAAVQNPRIIKGTEPGGIAAGVDYWVIVVSPTVIKLASSPLNAQLGIAIDITSAPSAAWEIGGNQGTWTRVGFDNNVPQTTAEGESSKLLRAAEQVIVSAKSVTVRSNANGDILKWWNIG